MHICWTYLSFHQINSFQIHGSTLTWLRLFYCGRLPRVKVTASRSDLFFTQPHQRRYTSLSLHTPLSRVISQQILMTFLILAKLEGIPSSSTAVVERHNLKHGFSYNALWYIQISFLDFHIFPPLNKMCTFVFICLL